MLRFRRPIAVTAATAAIAALGAAVTASGAISSGTPSQASNAVAAADAGFSGSGGLWGDLPGGVAARPYIRSLSVINGSVATPVIVDGTPTAPPTQTGDVTAVVAPFNLCRAGESPGPGRCYATPNRVGITLGYVDGGSVETDFATPGAPLRQPVDAGTVFDLTIGLNTLGTTLRWSWLNGRLDYWSATGLGREDAQIHVRLRPVVTPAIDWSLVPSNGCTATPIRDCAIAQSQGQTLSASMVLSLDDTLDASLTGAVFATRGAVAGFLQPSGTSDAPVLDLQVASAHLTAAGAPQTGELSALIPAQALLNLYGVPPADAAAFFTTRRTGDAGTQNAPTFTRWTAAANGTDGLLVDVSGITFSAPTYAVARRAAAVRTSALRAGGRTTVTAGGLRSCRARACTVTVMRIPSRTAGRASVVGSARTSVVGSFFLTVPAARLGPGSRYTLVYRSAAGTKRGTLVTTALGTVS